MILINPISPVALNFFGLEIRWYALAYIAAFVVGLCLMKQLDKGQSKKYWDDLFLYIILGVIIGGRTGYVLFYNLSYFIYNPFQIFAVWNGGMAFHGGLIGAIIATFLFADRQKPKIRAMPILDRLAVVGPIGLFFGRIANFINMEVMGRATFRSWGVVFNGSPDIIPRHPSPLYEAALEGILLFLIMLILWNTKLRNRAGCLSGMFGIFYGLFRIFCEFFREPDIQIGFLLGTKWLTMGMLLSSIMIMVGVGLVAKSKK